MPSSCSGPRSSIWALLMPHSKHGAAFQAWHSIFWGGHVFIPKPKTSVLWLPYWDLSEAPAIPIHSRNFQYIKLKWQASLSAAWICWRKTLHRYFLYSFKKKQHKCILLATVTAPIFKEIYYFHQRKVSDCFKIFPPTNPKEGLFLYFHLCSSLPQPSVVCFLLFSQLLPARRHLAHLRAKHRQTEVTNTVCERTEICSFMQDNYFFCFPLLTLSDDNSNEGENSASSGSDSILECHFTLWSSIPQNLDKVLWETLCGVTLLAEVNSH